MSTNPSLTPPQGGPAVVAPSAAGPTVPCWPVDWRRGAALEIISELGVAAESNANGLAEQVALVADIIGMAHERFAGCRGGYVDGSPRLIPGAELPGGTMATDEVPQ